MQKRGFTLIELLITITIIAILIGILLPALSSSRKLGRRSVALARLRDLGVGSLAYAQDNEDWFATLIDPEERSFRGLSHLGRALQLPPEVFLNPNTMDQATNRLTEDGRPILAEVDGAEITDEMTITPANIAQVRWHCSFSYDNDPKTSQTGAALKMNSTLPRVFMGDRADYENGRTYSNNWQGDGMTLLWTDGHAEFSKLRSINDQSDPNIYHHNEFEGEGGNEVNDGVAVSPATRDTHLRFFTEEEDDELLPD